MFVFSQNIIVITDGQSPDSAVTAAAAKRARDAGVRVLSVGIGLGYSMQVRHPLFYSFLTAPEHI